VQSKGAVRSHPEKRPAANSDIFFNCEHCKAPLVANRSAAGMSLSCQRCGKLTPVPKPAVAPAATINQVQDIQRRLAENESQRTEVTSYINQLSIQLHRWQLRMQILGDRKQQLEKELAGLKG
jgi:hypothetical protein